MEILTDAKLIAAIEAFVAAHKPGMSVTRLGRETMNDPALLLQLRKGRSLSLKNAEKIMQFMAEYEAAAQQDAAA